MEVREELHIIIVIILNPSGPKSDVNQISHCNIKGLSVREVRRVENMIT